MDSDPNKELIWFLSMIVLLWIVWYTGGGPARYEMLDKPFLKPPSPLNTGKTFGEVPDISDANVQIELGTESKSPLFSSVSSKAVKNGPSSLGYIEILNGKDAKGSINITGWKIKSLAKSKFYEIGEGVRVFYQGRVNERGPILLAPGQKVIISFDASPVGESFRLNKCSGYLQQFQGFNPNIPVSCPQPALDGQYIDGVDNNCLDFLRAVPRCNAYIKAFPNYLSESCKNESNKLNYNVCLDSHKGDPGFWSNEWRVFLNAQPAPEGKNGDILNIYDQKGNLVDTVFYKSDLIN